MCSLPWADCCFVRARPEVGWYGFGKPKSRTLEVFGLLQDSNAGETWLDTHKSCTGNRWKSCWKGVITSEWSDWPDDVCLRFKAFKTCSTMWDHKRLRRNMIRTNPRHGLQPEELQEALQVGLSALLGVWFKIWSYDVAILPCIDWNDTGPLKNRFRIFK